MYREKWHNSIWGTRGVGRGGWTLKGKGKCFMARREKRISTCSLLLPSSWARVHYCGWLQWPYMVLPKRDPTFLMVGCGLLHFVSKRNIWLWKPSLWPFGYNTSPHHVCKLPDRCSIFHASLRWDLSFLSGFVKMGRSKRSHCHFHRQHCLYAVG